MQPRSLADIARACRGTISGGADPSAQDPVVGPDVVIDSRRATPGALFVAFRGEHVDGHDFIDSAVANGAVAAITERPVAAEVPCVVVSDVERALAGLAHDVVTSSDHLRVIGVTGSSGKTSTKDLIAQVLDTAGPTVAPIGSFNNEIGAPLTATRCDDRTRFLVAEMGARGIGHVAHLCGITPPDVGVVLNVGHAHLGEFGSRDAIARAKGELVEAVPEEGWAVLNGDDPRVSAMAGRTSARVARFALEQPPADGGDVQVWATDIAPDDLDRYHFTLHVRGSEAGGDRAVPVSMRQVGAHHVPNALAAAAVGIVLGLDVDAVAKALSAAEPRSAWRMEVTERPDGVVVLNDSYNANPDSMASALRTLGRIGRARRARDPRARTYALLGDMLELGADAEDVHTSIGALAAEVGVTDVVAIGVFGEAICAGARQWARSHQGAEDIHATAVADKFAMTAAVPTLRSSDVVLVKASRGLALETVAEDLASMGSGEPSADETGDER